MTTRPNNNRVAVEDGTFARFRAVRDLMQHPDGREYTSNELIEMGLALVLQGNPDVARKMEQYIKLRGWN